tara:strand:+ start:106 stop:360 length:255 start_codon:yes stop_codon:yes gene_type:complete
VKKIKNATIEPKQIWFIPIRPSLFKRRKKCVSFISDYNFLEDNYNIMKIKIVGKDRTANPHEKLSSLSKYYSILIIKSKVLLYT